MFLKIAAQAFEAGDFVNIFKGFWVFEAYFLIKIFLMKKNVYIFVILLRTSFFQRMFFRHPIDS